jgi:hypothetical protein
MIFSKHKVSRKIRINFITFANPTNAYSGVQYICEELTRMGFDVELSCRIPSQQEDATKLWPFAIFNVASTWYGNAPIIRTAFYWLHIVGIFARGERNFIFHEAHFFRLIALFKRLSKKTRCVHYATELYTEQDEPAHANILAYYQRTASLPDLIVECDHQRAIYRQQKYGISAKICVIPNTLPITTYEKTTPSLLEQRILSSNSLKLPILIYSGAGFLHRELDRIIDGVSQAKSRVFLVIICYGPDIELEKVRQFALEKIDIANFMFVSNASRDDIKHALNIADAGVVYYRPSLSIGNRFAAPTKFFEYVSAGVRVVSSHNETLKPLIDLYQLGHYTRDESPGAIAIAIDAVFEVNEDSSMIRSRIRNVFEEKLCFEIAARDGMQEIRKIFFE